eukprot:TRINITY_DN257_c0_g1_i5.p1 TRINITY_DN257_c0_g1~~TRINITY_DN257_c0_g1_i5.p1  ORF type:complete len:142 (-),score=22.23 TRINITY_DN257_c0_g1_i5:95-520(-)
MKDFYSLLFQKQIAKESFISILSLDDFTLLTFSIDTLLELCNWSVEDALQLYLNDPSEISKIAPPHLTGSSLDELFNNNEVSLSCGHVESNLPSNKLYDLRQLLLSVSSGLIHPKHIDGDYGEYSSDSFNLLLPISKGGHH